MIASILVIGDEILSGATKDANAGYPCEKLDALGYVVDRVAFVPDRAEAIRDELTHALARGEIAFLTGGLGPTHDDRTTAAVAEHFARKLVLDEAGWERLVSRYAKRNPSPATVEAARKMCLVPEGSTPLRNPVGAASAYLIEDAGRRAFVLPGVPAELRGIFEEEIMEKLLPRRERPAVAELDVFLPEAAFAADLERIEAAHPGVTIGSYPHFGEPRVTLRFRGEKEAVERAREAARRLLAA